MTDSEARIDDLDKLTTEQLYDLLTDENKEAIQRQIAELEAEQGKEATA